MDRNTSLESKGKFQILQFDFSQVLDRVENLETDFNTYCCSCLNQFVQKYQNYYTKDTVEWALAATTSKDKINILSKEAKERGYHLYLIIDEYDNFTNTVLNELGEDTYHNMTHSSGFTAMPSRYSNRTSNVFSLWVSVLSPSTI